MVHPWGAPMSENNAHVVVIGAGLSGLSAARTLAAAGCSVVVLEARDRVGGRTLTETIGGARVDMGGQWLGPTQKRMLALCSELGVETFSQYESGRKVLEVHGRRSTYAHTIPRVAPHNLWVIHRAISKIEKMRKQVPTDAPHLAPRAREWDAITLGAWARKALPFAVARGLFDVVIQTVFGAEAAEVSLLHALFYANAAGGFETSIKIKDSAQQLRFVPGAQEVSLRLAAKLGERVRLATPVRAIEHDERGVLVRSDQASFAGRFAIVAVPPTLAGRIDYRPGLPCERDQLLQRVPQGATTKCVVSFARPFWREAGLSGEAVSVDGPCATWFDDTSHDGKHAALLGFLVGQRARSEGARPLQERKSAVLAQLVRLFGEPARAVTGYHEKDWQVEEWTRGCPVGSYAPGALTAFGHLMRAPAGPIHFAGTETASEWNGYMEGAVQAGERAAQEIVVPAAPAGLRGAGLGA